MDSLAYRKLLYASAAVIFGVLGQAVARGWVARDLTGSNTRLGGVMSGVRRAPRAWSGREPRRARWCDVGVRVRDARRDAVGWRCRGCVLEAPRAAGVAV